VITAPPEKTLLVMNVASARSTAKVDVHSHKLVHISCVSIASQYSHMPAFILARKKHAVTAFVAYQWAQTAEQPTKLPRMMVKKGAKEG
jgi:hypothetical protein